MQSILPQLHHYQRSNERRRGRVVEKGILHFIIVAHVTFVWCQTFPAVSKALLCWIYWIVFWKIESGELNIHREETFSL